MSVVSVLTLGFLLFPSHPRAQGKTQQNRKLTDFYPVRRSSRKSKAELQVESRGFNSGSWRGRAAPWAVLGRQGLSFLSVILG